MERLEVLKWLQKYDTLVGIFFQHFPSFKTDLLFLWARIYMLVFLHTAASSHIFYLELLCGTNPPSLKREGGDLFLIACTRQRGGDVRTSLGGFILLFSQFLVQKSRGQSKESHFPTTLFTNLVSDFSYLYLELPITQAFLWCSA